MIFTDEFLIKNVCMSVLPACLFMYHLNAMFPRRPERDIRSPDTELQMVVNHQVNA